PPMIDPPNGGEFVYSACHMHYHFNTFARYELRQPGTSTVVTVGQKRSFCVEDTVQVSDSAPVDKKYCCNSTCGNLQGVQVGWAAAGRTPPDGCVAEARTGRGPVAAGLVLVGGWRDVSDAGVRARAVEPETRPIPGDGDGRHADRPGEGEGLRLLEESEGRSG